MSAEKKYTERDLVLAKREAFADGIAFRYAQTLDLPDHRLHCDTVEARRRYPLPKVTRPRVVRVEGRQRDMEYRVIGNDVQFRSTKHKGADWQSSSLTPSALRELADLLANPTETVEEGE